MLRLKAFSYAYFIFQEFKAAIPHLKYKVLFQTKKSITFLVFYIIEMNGYAQVCWLHSGGSLFLLNMFSTKNTKQKHFKVACICTMKTTYHCFHHSDFDIGP